MAEVVQLGKYMRKRCQKVQPYLPALRVYNIYLQVSIQ